MSTKNETRALIHSHLSELCVTIGSRPTGSENNKKAQNYVSRVFEGANLEVKLQSFDCLDWEAQGLTLLVGGRSIEAVVNPFSPACDVQAPSLIVNTLDELTTHDITDKIVVLDGDLSKEPLMPKNFRFWNPEEHQKIVSVLETKSPKAIIAVCQRPSSVEPIIEDGDFKIPSVTVPLSTRKSLLENQRGEISLQIISEVRQSSGANVIARKNPQNTNKIVVCAHIDTKMDTHGAIDNGSGIATILALAQLMKDVDVSVGMELVCFNGEDYYSTPGQIEYLEHFEKDFNTIKIAINIDGVGIKGKNNSVAFFECSRQLVDDATRLMKNYPAFEQVDPWPQGDHSLFWSQGVPSVAISSKGIEELITSVIHTSNDTIDLLSVDNIAEAVFFVQDLIHHSAST